jgi:ABC-type multidrug transport system permease subunit
LTPFPTLFSIHSTPLARTHSLTSLYFLLSGIVLLLGMMMSLNLAIAIGLRAASQSRALFFTMAAYTLGIVLCGVYWPLEAQPYLLRPFTLLMPTTWITCLCQACFLNHGMVGAYAWCTTGVVVLWGVLGYWHNVWFVSRLMIRPTK